MSKDVIQPKAEIDLLELMQHHDDIHAALLELLFPCAHCGRKVKKTDSFSTREIYIRCPCGVSVSGGMLEVLSAWNRRDGKDFDLDSEYAQRLVASESKYASFRASAVREFAALQARVDELQKELGRKGK